MKLKTILICALSLFILTSCDSYYEDPDVVNANREAVTDISGSAAADSAVESASASEIVTNSTESVDAVDDNNPSSENNLFGIDRQHDVTVNGENITLQMSYGIPKERIDNYLYTVPTVLELKAKVLNNPNNRYRVKVSNLYADVGLLSDSLKNKSLLQDTMNLSFMMLPSGGYDIDQDNSFCHLFKVKGINQSSEFMSGFHGFGYGNGNVEVLYLTEDKIKQYVNGAVLQPIWAISIIDDTTNKIYASSITDEILMKHQ